MDVVGLLVVAFAAGMLGGMVGVGGGVLFVPGLVVLMDLTQLEAEATSLVAVVAVGAVGAWRQHGYGNLHVREGLLVGVPAVAGVLIGTELQPRMSTKAISLVFAALLVVVAGDLLFELG